LKPCWRRREWAPPTPSLARATVRKAKLAKLLEIEGYESVEDLIEALFSVSISPAICINEDCTFTCEMEPDQDAGYCD
jgi:hypothetical protein